MSELIINATPSLPPSGTGNAAPVSPSDASSRSGESITTGTDNKTESPFAAVLKSRMDNTPADASSGNSAASSDATLRADTEDTTNIVDLSALLPFFGVNSSGIVDLAAAPGATTKPRPDEILLPALQTAADPASVQLLSALPPASAVALPVASVPSTLGAPASSASAAALRSAPTDPLPPAPGKAKDSSLQQQNTGTKAETLLAAEAAKPGGTTQVAGKMALDAAINAEAGSKKGEQSASEFSATDFRTVMERAATMTPTVATTANSSPSSPNLRIDTPLGQTGWHDEMGQKLTWMIGNNRQQADLVLNPPQLGRIEVSLTMNGDQATAIFTSPNPTVREALESSLHRLREVLADAGVSLGQTQVGSESPRQSSARNDPDFGLNEGVRYASTIPLPAVEGIARSGSGRSMIDIFA